MLAFLFVTDINECSSDPCRNGGNCTDLINGFICKCPQPWKGKLCQSSKYLKIFSYILCFFNGIEILLFLISVLSKTAHKFNLSLINGFVSTATSHCNGSPCQNGGKCTDTGDNFRCECQNGFTGIICQIGKTRFILIYRLLAF